MVPMLPTSSRVLRSQHGFVSSLPSPPFCSGCCRPCFFEVRVVLRFASLASLAVCVTQCYQLWHRVCSPFNGFAILIIVQTCILDSFCKRWRLCGHGPKHSFVPTIVSKVACISVRGTPLAARRPRGKDGFASTSCKGETCKHSTTQRHDVHHVRSFRNTKLVADVLVQCLLMHDADRALENWAVRQLSLVVRSTVMF